MSSLIGPDGEIINGLRADLMRTCMENKNLLTKKGSLYMGTGENSRLVIDNIIYDIPVTKELEVGPDNSVLVVKEDEDTHRNTLAYSKIYPEMIEENQEWNINCTKAKNIIGSADTARYAEYASADHSKGTIDQRLNIMEATISSTNITVTPYIESTDGSGGTVTKKNITKKFKTVTMDLEIKNLSLHETEYEGVVDKLVISIPSAFRPKGCTVIFATISGEIYCSNSIPGAASDYIYAADNIPFTVPIKLDYENPITLYPRYIVDNRTKVEDHLHSVNKEEAYVIAQATLRIHTSWNIEEPSVDICLAERNSAGKHVVWIRLGQVDLNEFYTVRGYFARESSPSQWSTYVTSTLFDQIPNHSEFASGKHIKYASFIFSETSDLFPCFCKAEIEYNHSVTQRPSTFTQEVYIEN